jgi:hypothetical protein
MRLAETTDSTQIFFAGQVTQGKLVVFQFQAINPVDRGKQTPRFAHRPFFLAP